LVVDDKKGRPEFGRLFYQVLTLMDDLEYRLKKTYVFFVQSYQINYKGHCHE